MGCRKVRVLECTGVRPTGRSGFFDASKLEEGEDPAEAERRAYRAMKAGRADNQAVRQQRRQ